ncbi:MAG: cell envelope integrity protein CreD [Chitinophagaceae bacterium]|nr:cell envelope integrity protein CreD [Chitinophagaceae bacterium]
MEQQNFEQPQTFFEKHKTLAKGLFIGFLVLLMLIPTAYIMVLVTERAHRQNEVIAEISDKWAKEQTITGPVISVPYYVDVKNKDGGTVRSKRALYLLPEQLSINGKVMPEIRHRSIYDVTVYRSDLVLQGSFDPTVLKAKYDLADDLDWNNAQLIVGINDARGLEEEPQLKWADTSTYLETSLAYIKNIDETLSADIKFNSNEKTNFRITLKLKGTGQLYFTPSGKTTTVNLSSTWSTPAFDGKYLPDRTPKLSDSGFSASWKILQASRGYPQCWSDDTQPEFQKSAFGVKLIQQADHYTKTERSVKYAILIISLTFLVFFFIEMLQKKSVHLLQYILVGIALCVFYTLLLSISEYAGFNIAYLIAATATVSLITWYIKNIFSKNKVALAFAAALSSLYIYVFFLIQLKDYALLFGSIGLFIILAIVMYYSRNIDWYNSSKTKKIN